MVLESARSIGNPSAISMAGASTSARLWVPNSASMVMIPPGVPGVTAASGPYSGGYRSPSLWKYSGGARVGATPSLLMATPLPVDGWTSGARAAPPQESVVQAAADAAIMAQAASTAFPPRVKTCAPALAAIGLPVTAIQCWP